MIRYFLIAAAFAATALPGPSALAQSGAQSGECDTYEVEARLLNVRSEPSVFGRILDVLSEDQIVCVSQIETTSGQQWGNVLFKTDPGSTEQVPVNGWASLRFMTEATTTTAAALPSQTTPTVTVETETNQTTEQEQPVTPVVIAPSSADIVLTFTDPVPYGAFPVQGRSLQELAQGIPLFPPFAGLPEDRWRNQCTTCHQWNAARLCQQGSGYAANPASTLRIQHPYGGPYKKTLGDWAAAGCN